WPPAVLWRFAVVEPRARAADRLPGRVLVLLGGTDRVAAPLRQLGAHLRPAALRPRLEPRPRRHGIPRTPRRARRPHGPSSLKRRGRRTPDCARAPVQFRIRKTLSLEVWPAT